MENIHNEQNSKIWNKEHIGIIHFPFALGSNVGSDRMSPILSLFQILMFYSL